jgi:hypothetical protein
LFAGAALKTRLAALENSRCQSFVVASDYAATDPIVSLSASSIIGIPTTVGQVIYFDGKLEDTHNGWSAPIYTIKVAGLYRIDGSMRSPGDVRYSTGTQFILDVLLNGNAVCNLGTQWWVDLGFAGGTLFTTGSCVRRFAVNDQIQWALFQTSGSTIYLHGPQSCRGSLQRIAP